MVDVADNDEVQQPIRLSSRPSRQRRLPPLRYLILLLLWAAFILWMTIGTVINFSGLVSASSGDEYAFHRNGYAGVLFGLDLWGLAAGLLFGLMIFNPMRWLNGKRLIFGCMAFATILGRLVGGGFAGLLLFTPLPAWFIVALTPFALLLGGVSVIFGIALLIGTIFTFFVGIPVMLFKQILEFDNEVQRYRYQAQGLASYIVRATYWLRNERLPRAPPDDSKGARFATHPEIAKIYQPVPESIAFGHRGQPLFLKTDKHVLIMASTRSGKGVTLIIPHLLRYQGSAFVLDPKGENAKATGRQRARLNGKVHYLDPFGVSGKPQSRFNPLARFTPQNMEAESKALAAALFVVGERERDHWSASGQQLLAAIILYVYVSPDIPKENKDLPTVRRILLGSLKEVLEAMVKIDEADGLLRDLAMSFLVTPEKEFGSIASTAQRQTEILDNPFMIACLSAKGTAPEVDFKDWHRGTMSVFLCLSAPKFPTFNRWLRLVLTSALDEMTDTLNPPKLPVCFMLDELATLGHLTTVENAVGLAAGYGIQLVTVFQDVAQMRGLYKGRWASFIGNSGVRALFNLDDFETAEYWSKFVGNRIVETRGRQEDVYGLSSGSNVSETMRPLIPPEQIMFDFSSGKMLVLAQGAHPIVSNRVAYWEDTGLKGLWDDPRAPSPAPSAAPPPPPPPPGRAPPPPGPQPGPGTPRQGPPGPGAPRGPAAPQAAPRTDRPAAPRPGSTGNGPPPRAAAPPPQPGAAAEAKFNTNWVERGGGLTQPGGRRPPPAPSPHQADIGPIVISGGTSRSTSSLANSQEDNARAVEEAMRLMAQDIARSRNGAAPGRPKSSDENER